MTSRRTAGAGRPLTLNGHGCFRPEDEVGTVKREKKWNLLYIRTSLNHASGCTLTRGDFHPMVASIGAWSRLSPP